MLSFFSVKPTDFEFLKVIGKGSFGKVNQLDVEKMLWNFTGVVSPQVLLSRHKEEGTIYAIKVLQKQQIRKNNEIRHIMSERNVSNKEDEKSAANLQFLTVSDFVEKYSTSFSGRPSLLIPN